MAPDFPNILLGPLTALTFCKDVLWRYYLLLTVCIEAAQLVQYCLSLIKSFMCPRFVLQALCETNGSRKSWEIRHNSTDLCVMHWGKFQILVDLSALWLFPCWHLIPTYSQVQKSETTYCICINTSPTNMVKGTYLINNTNRTFACGFRLCRVEVHFFWCLFASASTRPYLARITALSGRFSWVNNEAV